MVGASMAIIKKIKKKKNDLRMTTFLGEVASSLKEWTENDQGQKYT